MDLSTGCCWNMIVEGFMVICRMWIGVVLCVIGRDVGNFVPGVNFSKTQSVNALSPVGANSTDDVVGMRQDFGDFVWPNPMKRLQIGLVRLCVVVGAEHKYEFANFDWFNLGFWAIVTFVSVKNFKDIVSSDFVLFVGLVNQYGEVRLGAGRLDPVCKFQTKSVVGHAVLEDFSWEHLIGWWYVVLCAITAMLTYLFHLSESQLTLI